VGGLIRTGDTARIVSGEFAMLVLATTSGVREQQVKGAPLGFAFLEDGVSVGYIHLGGPRTAAHPNLAKLYVNMVMSEAGQRALYESWYVDHAFLPGSQSAPELLELRARGVDILEVDVKFMFEHPELRELANEMQRILREKRPNWGPWHHCPGSYSASSGSSYTRPTS
jgi:ABC-type Fe3+ transport system substrate-binding protein